MPDFATITGVTGTVTGVIALIVSIREPLIKLLKISSV
jgi:hypothetical protein